MNSNAAELREEQAKALLKLAYPERYGHLELNYAGHVLYNYYRSGLEQAEKQEGLEHQLFDPEKEWEENRDWLVQEMKKGNTPKRETLTTHADRLLLSEAWGEFLKALQADCARQKRMAKTALYNLNTYEFFWQRLRAHWLYFLPQERLKIVTELTRFKWREKIPHEVTSIIESAQLLLEFDFKMGREPEKHAITGEECDYIVDFAFSADHLGHLLFGMYRRKSRTDLG